MTWHRKVPRKTLGLAAAGGVVALIAVMVASYAFLFVGPVRGSGTGGVPGCTPVKFIAATGSGEYPSSDQDLGASPELNLAIYKNMADVLTTQWGADQVAATIDVRVLTYAPNDIDVLLQPLKELHFDPGRALHNPAYAAQLTAEIYNALKVSVPSYLDSEPVGVSELQALFNSTRQTCPTTKFVLAGYSQGAMVVHDFLNQLATKHDKAGQASIIGVALLGDPDRVRYSGAHEFGTASSASYGACNVPRVAGLPQCSATPGPQDIPSMFQARTVSVCMYDDPVCDSSDFVPDFVRNYIATLGDGDGFVSLGFGIHLSYRYAPDAALAGKLIGRFVAASV